MPDSAFECQLRKHSAHLVRLKSSCEDLSRYIEIKTAATPRLGRYFEALLGYWIERILCPGFFEANLVIQSPSTPTLKAGTLGELDLLFQMDPTQPAQHWEAAVKYYLYAGTTPAQALKPKYFVGPMVRDRLDLKIMKLFSHQLGLPKTPAALAELAHRNIHSCQSKAVIKGTLFYPFENDWRNHTHPPEVSPHHQRGWWLSHERTSILSPHSGSSRFILLEKPRWLSAVDPRRVHASELLDITELRQSIDTHFTHSQQALMLAEVDEKTEVSRGLVVGPQWHASALQKITAK